MKKTNSPRRSHEIRLPNRLVKAWQNTLLQIARMKGIAKTQDDKQKLAHIARSEQHNVKQLWEAFTTDREQLPRYLLDPKKQTTAYLLGFHLPNVARSWNLLRRLEQRYNFDELVKSFDDIRAYDLGCGTGSMGHALTAYLESCGKETITQIGLIDQQGPFLDAARIGYESMEFKGTLRSTRGSLEDSLKIVKRNFEPEALNIVMMGYVWNEVSRNPKAQTKLLELLSQLTEGNTIVLFLEPANQFIARSAMELRDELNLMNYNSVYPCIHRNPCPMLSRSKDWCYSEATWDVPDLLARVDKKLLVNRERLKYTGHALVSPKVLEKLTPRFPAQAYPIVGLPTIKGKDAGRFEYLVCQESTLEKFGKQTSAKKNLTRGSLLYTQGVDSE